MSAPGDGDRVSPNREQGVREEPTLLPSTAERRAFRLLPWAWIGVLVLGAVILYLVFR